MRISEICIRRPVLAWVLTLVLILVGVVGGSRLPVQQYPRIERSFVTVETQLPGAGPEIVEAQVTRVVEEAIAGIEGVEHITSTSSTEDSKVSVEFVPERSMDNAINDIRDRLARSKNLFPDDATEPTLTKSRAEEKPIIGLSLTSDTIAVSELNDYALREIQKDLEALPGVARVDVVGAGQYEMKIYLDPLRLAAYHLTVSEVITAIKRQSIEKPAGKIISRDREYLVTTVANLDKPEEFENLVIATRKSHMVRIKDIGRAEISSNDRRTKNLYNGHPGVNVSVIKQSQANPIDVARAVKLELKKIESALPEGMKIQVGSDKTLFIERSLKEVYETIGEATFLVILVVFLFLRSARASLVPLVTIPVSLVGGLFLMYLLNFSINMFTLMAMVLAIGLVVDDAIVVLENVYRHIEKGEKPFDAAFKGVREISFAVIAMTLTLAAVYAPVALARGMTGKLLTEFSITLAGSVIISGFAALTLSPMMCARLLQSHQTHQGEGRWETLKSYIKTDVWMGIFEKRYEETLNWALKNRFKIVLLALAVASIGGIVHRYLPSELTPREDQGAITMEGQGPQTATLDYTERYVRKLDAILAKYPEVDRRVVNILNPTFDVMVQLKNKRSRSTEEIALQVRREVETITGIETRVSSGSTGISGDDSRSVQFVVRGNKTYRELRDVAQMMIYELYQSGIVSGVNSEIRGDTSDYTVTILREKVSSLSIEPATIAETIDALIRGKKANTFKKDNKLYDVRVEVQQENRTTPEHITDLYVKAGDKEGTLVSLSELVTVNPRSGPIEIHHDQRMRAITIVGYLKPGYSVGQGVAYTDKIAKEAIPSDMRFGYIGETQRFLTESHTMALVFALALCFIYLVMAAQFESWRDPFVILLSVPMSLSGAIVTLGLLEGATLNLYSNIGLVTLIGLITKHGILMVDFANSLRGEGVSAKNAILKASVLRLRPILMTTFAMVFGALPLAWGNGAGAESRRQLGWVIVGGMSLGTLFTLFVVPVFYTLFTRRNVKNP